SLSLPLYLLYISEAPISEINIVEGNNGSRAVLPVYLIRGINSNHATIYPTNINMLMLGKTFIH
ncbi:MAG TPA: hypothetical protein DCM59_02485, partial [Clostridium sp.]|nr:hypothetical protein [Clostridium sp.]